MEQREEGRLLQDEMIENQIGSALFDLTGKIERDRFPQTGCRIVLYVSCIMCGGTNHAFIND